MHRNTVTCNPMVCSCFLNDGIDSAVNLVDQMPGRDLFSYNTMIFGLMQCGRVETARETFDAVLIKGDVSWNSMVAGYM